MKEETEKLILKVLEDKEFCKDYPFFVMGLLKVLPHSYSITYETYGNNAIQDMRKFIEMERELHK